MIKDLLIKSYSAQVNYVLSKTVLNIDKMIFKESSEQILSTLINTNADMVEMAYSNNATSNSRPQREAYLLFEETYNNLYERFIDGRSGEAYMEKIL